MRAVLYLHGFASSPSGRKISLLRKALPPAEFRLVAPDLNRPSFQKLDFDAIVDAALAAARADPPDVVVGSSLGALVGIAASQKGLTVPLVLIAPALGFGSRWLEKLAPGDPVRFFHHGQGRELEIHRRFFEQMAQLKIDREAPPQRVTVLMGANDESVPFAGVSEVWQRWEASGQLAGGSSFTAIPNGDHGLVEHVGLIADAIRSSVTTG